jgi:hypothetical protein
MTVWSQQRHDESIWAQDLFVDILNYKTERNAKVNDNIYGIDVVTDEYDFEVEIKHNWVGREFIYDTMHYAARKRKFITPRSFFVTFNSDATRYFITHSSALKDQNVIMKDTKYSTLEPFIVVPVRLGHFNDVPNEIRKAYP